MANTIKIPDSLLESYLKDLSTEIGDLTYCFEKENEVYNMLYLKL